MAMGLIYILSKLNNYIGSFTLSEGDFFFDIYPTQCEHERD